MKNLQVLLNSIILIFLTSFYGCLSSQTQQNESNNINFNWIIDNYIDFYSKKVVNFNPKERYLMMSVSEDINNKQTYIYLFDNCYNCSSVENNDNLILLYKGYRVIIATDNFKNKEIILKNFKKISIGTHFKNTPYNNNSIYDYARQWEIKCDDKGKLIFFCNSILNELEDTKKRLGLNSSIEDCRLPTSNSLKF